jgi:hypothetical protein
MGVGGPLGARAACEAAKGREGYGIAPLCPALSLPCRRVTPAPPIFRSEGLPRGGRELHVDLVEVVGFGISSLAAPRRPAHFAPATSTRYILLHNVTNVGTSPFSPIMAACR